MAVCQFYLRGTCKFGNNCRNEHPRDGPRQGGFGSACIVHCCLIHAYVACAESLLFGLRLDR
ncbi:hypothetical protein K466DRAFT_119297 [Polyporus arcularius HHB13444]|uniref:C3H1-type domain-containing protein n=1 Tax=Polyporus arcularius HHB13444 TaxID=1314778 RepID=A0A5C3Q8X2_9APHY|nr:hypothetical protein K466DRAFT_119297 [Polyporus arcularius HHB13444]